MTHPHREIKPDKTGRGGGNAPYCTEKLVVEVDCRSPEATVTVTSHLPVRALGGRVMGKAEL